MNQIVYEFKYCSNTYESSASTVSIHKTYKGAYKSMKNHMYEEYNQWLEYSSFFRKRFKWNSHREWFITKTELLD